MGRTIWVVVDRKDLNIAPFAYSINVTGFRRFLPAGPVAFGEASAQDGIRIQPLVQLWGDNGLHTVATASIRLKKPGAAGSQAEDEPDSRELAQATP